MKTETKLTVQTTFVCLCFGLWQESVWAGLFLGSFLTLIVSSANAYFDAVYGEDLLTQHNNHE